MFKKRIKSKEIAKQAILMPKILTHELECLILTMGILRVKYLQNFSLVKLLWETWSTAMSMTIHDYPRDIFDQHISSV